MFGLEEVACKKKAGIRREWSVVNRN